eukprot:PhF_6_TR3306/c0_g1_i1/m.4664
MQKMKSAKSTGLHPGPKPPKAGMYLGWVSERKPRVKACTTHAPWKHCNSPNFYLWMAKLKMKWMLSRMARIDLKSPRRNHPSPEATIAPLNGRTPMMNPEGRTPLTWPTLIERS